MIGLLQRVTSASVAVGGRQIAQVGRGLLVLVGVQKDDAAAQAGRLLERLLDYRVFPDVKGRMNLSLRDDGDGHPRGILHRGRAGAGQGAVRGPRGARPRRVAADGGRGVRRRHAGEPRQRRAGNILAGDTMSKETLSKVPEVTLIFWIVKIAATTLGETGGDAVSMSMDLGYLVATGIFAAIFVLAVGVQIAARRFHPALYWATIIATTTVGTTMADFATRSLGIGYAGGSLLLLTLLLASLWLWHRTLGSVSIDTVSTPQTEMFYWVTIMFSQTLGTALGDWTADTRGLGYLGSAVIFGALLALTAAAYYRTKLSHTLLFWTAFILTRPLGAVLGDFLDKPLEKGGLNLSRYTASATLLVAIVVLMLAFPQKAARKVH
jgi:uncharacterized membrane-anchored protein